MTTRSDLSEGAVFNCCFLVCLYFTFNEPSAVWIYIVYFCNVNLSSSFVLKQPIYIVSRTNATM